MITKNERIGGWDITHNGVSVWIKGSKREAEQELKTLKKEAREMELKQKQAINNK